MARSHFTVVAKNPNTRGACLCSPTKLQDCAGPYIVFGHTEMMDPRNLHPVLSVACACAATAKAAKRADAPACAKPAEPTAPTRTYEIGLKEALEAATADELLAALTQNLA